MSNKAKLSREHRIKVFKEKVFQALKILEERIDVLQRRIDETNERFDRSGRTSGDEVTGTSGNGTENVSESGSVDVSKTEGESNAPVSTNGGVDTEYRG